MANNKNLKPLVINTKAAQAAGSEFTWNKLQNPEVFIGGIVTQEVNIENSEELNKLISGIPTPFARMSMFKYAINYVGQAGDDLTGLMAFYKTLQNEWKGLVACLALDNQYITVDKIHLSYSDEKAIDETVNLYEPKGAFGNMLSEERSLWCDQQAQLDTTKKTSPYIYIIRYNGAIVGATSPESLLFTAPTYNININKGFYNQITKKFTDPLTSTLTSHEVESLYVYVKHINQSINNYVNQFTSRKPDVQKISVFLNKWLGEINLYAKAKGFKIDENAIVPNLNKFQSPFDKLFNYKTTLYGFSGRITSDLDSLNIPKDDQGNMKFTPTEVELTELLANPDTSTVVEIIFDEQKDAENSAVNLLKAISDKGIKYFTIPLSEKGLAIFQNELDGLLMSGGDLKSNISAFYRIEKKELEVTLLVDLNGVATPIKRIYKDPIRIDGQKIICWPNFVSKIWNKYYLYSELPHNAQELKAFPLRADKNDWRFLDETVNGKYQFSKIDGRKKIIEQGAEILIEYDINKLGSNDLKYEVYESNEPFKGIEFQSRNKTVGYLVFKNINSGNANTLRDFRSQRTTLNSVRVGFDFGSNNICISFAERSGKPELIDFANRRVLLLGVDETDIRKAAAPNEVFFFQNEKTRSNMIKSMVMIHDERRVKDVEKDPKVILQREIKGGFPVFEKNIPVEDSAESTHTIIFAKQPSYIKFNMKWSNDDKENAYKQGLLKSLWLMTYAELLDKEKFPESLVWAYPSSMNKQMLLKYGNLWNEIGQVCPLKAAPSSEMKYEAKVAQFIGSISNIKSGFGGSSSGGAWSAPTFGGGLNAKSADGLEAQTEAASVCKHAKRIGFETGKRGLIIGFDVGGSTTDILCVVSKKEGPESYPDTLIKQSSIKFAAGRIADATKKSKKFQEVLKSFCRKKGMNIHGITIPPDRLNSNTSPYYYNLIVDQLSSQSELDEFYKNIAADCPELFVLNSFMTGLIMFYSGQLAYKIRLTQEENAGDYLGAYENIQIGCFGKGGRMFDWLKAMNLGSSNNYYQACFGEGYGVKAVDHIKQFKIVELVHQDVKAEVSFGLASDTILNITNDQISEIIGEEGFTYNGANIDQLSSVESRFMQNFGNQFSTPREFKRFTDFAKIFYEFSKEFFGFNLPTIQAEINSMRLKSYVENIPEYQLAMRAQEFDYEAPIIMLEGMCFLDTVLMPKLFGN